MPGRKFRKKVVKFKKIGCHKGTRCCFRFIMAWYGIEVNCHNGTFDIITISKIYNYFSVLFYWSLPILFSFLLNHFIYYILCQFAIFTSSHFFVICFIESFLLSIFLFVCGSFFVIRQQWFARERFSTLARKISWFVLINFFFNSTFCNFYFIVIFINFLFLTFLFI